MNRYEEIHDAALECSRDTEICHQWSFIKGAEWSDEYPKEGMVDINEIGDWLIKNKDAFVTDHGFEMVRCVYHMKKSFDAYMQAKRDMTKKVLDVKF